MSPVSILDTRPLVDRVADELRAQVIDGRLEPGRRVRQEQIAAELGISRTPLREAFRRLENEGWFVSHARQGLVTTGLSIDEVTEIAIVRLSLEPIAARVAAETHDDSAAERLIDNIDTYHEDGVTYRPVEFQDINRSFHFEIYGAGEVADSDLTRQTAHYWQKFARYRHYYWQNHEHVALSTDAHRSIARLWCDREGAETEYAVAEHILEAIVDQLRSLDPELSPDPRLRSVCARYGLASRLT